jgi:hypothetical protein
MRETIDQIRGLLSELESQAFKEDKAVKFRAFSGLELPDIICDVVDLLMPELKPYEVSFYLHFLRHSIIENGAPYVRVSQRGMQSGVIKSAYTGSTSGGKDAESGVMSQATVRQTITSLTTIGAIRREGDPNREGTLIPRPPSGGDRGLPTPSR